MNKSTTRAAYFALALLALVMSLSFAACTGKQPAADPTAKPTADATASETAEPAKTVEPAATVDPNYHYLTYEEVYNPETDFNNDLAHGYVTILDTEKAYYYAGDKGWYLYYYDKNTGECDVLCSKPECMHDDTRDNKSCNGYIHTWSTTLNLFDDKIWFWQADNSGVSSLFRMNLDGTGHEKLFSIPQEDSYYVPMRGGIHRGKFYGSNWGSMVKDAEPLCFWSVSCWDIDTGECKVICEDANPDGWLEPSLFFFGKYVYICAAFTESEYDENDREIIGDSHIKVYRYDTETEQLETLCDITEPGYVGGSYSIYVAAEDRVYVAPIGGNITVYQVKDGKLIKLFDAVLCAKFSLLTDKAIAAEFKNTASKNISEWRMHIIAYDYEGRILFEDTAGFDILLNEYANTRFIGAYGIYAFDGAIFIDYCLNLDAKGNDTDMVSCLVKYELVDGKFEDTIIAAAKWG